MNQDPQHNFAYFGTPTVARETLELLLARGFAPALVVTGPDAPKGRGLALTPSPVKTLAEERGLPVVTPAALDDAAIEAIRARGCDYAVVVAYGKIFPETLIAAFPKGVVNVHYSLLPRHRGATPVEAALLAGDAVTGVTIQKMVKELDAGDVLAQEETPIDADETARELRPRLITLGAELLADTLPALERGELRPVPQDASRATHSGKLKKQDGELSLDGSADENWRKYRAFADTIGTYFFENGARMKITKASFKGSRFVVERVIPEGKRETAYAGS
ncbi:MAG TPA: methionyl-tRNA formyltransferase [Candidatus Paceibacterota bacterium]|nr:methionyl-tRNA formyltransferase [Candidatus Paceibacterota bacterium]